MHIPEEAPPLNPWPFIVGDVALIAVAFLLAEESSTPLSTVAVVAIASCIALGAVLAVIPFLLNYVRSQETALMARQREITILAQTTANAAEQIGTTVANLNAVAENTSRSLKLAEALPHKLQEKINDFKAQLNEVAVTENESLAQEINTLRASETERLETALSGIRKITVDFTALEAAQRKQLKDLSETLDRAIASADKSTHSLAAQLSDAQAESEKALLAAHQSATSMLQSSLARVLNEFEEKLATLPASAPATSAPQIAASAPEQVPVEPASKAHDVLPVPPAPEVVEAPEPPKVEVTPIPAEPEPEATSKALPPAEDVPARAEMPAKKRTPRRVPEGDNELSLGLDIPSAPDDFSQVARSTPESSMSADGVTRLIVTAYIGIGNRLFVRGDGPGLSWDRGVPLQFVSIGKWRWESAETQAPVTLKLFKNDSVECASVGTVTIDPGNQCEVTASFA